ncbi:MAG: hypothetical protein WCQ50_17315 [Spirochaetota bacterium]
MFAAQDIDAHFSPVTECDDDEPLRVGKVIAWTLWVFTYQARFPMGAVFEGKVLGIAAERLPEQLPGEPAADAKLPAPALVAKPCQANQLHRRKQAFQTSHGHKGEF